MPHYTVVEVKQKGLMGKRLSAADLQQAINEHAHKGLILDRIVSGETALHLVGVKNVYLLIFREEYEAPGVSKGIRGPGETDADRLIHGGGGK